LYGATTFSITTFRITTLSIMGSFATLSTSELNFYNYSCSLKLLGISKSGGPVTKYLTQLLLIVWHGKLVRLFLSVIFTGMEKRFIDICAKRHLCKRH
jgi:hypothetical protein